MTGVERMAGACPRRRSGIRVELAGERLTLRDPGREEVFVVNDTALAIWEQCDGETTPDEIVRGIAALFDAAADVIAEGVDTILVELTRASLIDWPPA